MKNFIHRFNLNIALGLDVNFTLHCLAEKIAILRSDLLVFTDIFIIRVTQDRYRVIRNIRLLKKW